MSTTVLVGILSAVGGVVATGGMQLLTARLQRRRDGRVAARVLYRESALSNAIIHGWPEKPIREDELRGLKRSWDAWVRYRDALAISLNAGDWMLVSLAFTTYEQAALYRLKSFEDRVALHEAATWILYKASGRVTSKQIDKHYELAAPVREAEPEGSKRELPAKRKHRPNRVWK
jgi:hypothetical protein